jgi:hypothetical protein
VLTAVLQNTAQFGIRGAYPPPGATLDDLRARVAAALREIRARYLAANSATDQGDMARAVFGRDFVFLPELAPPPADLTDALAEGLNLARVPAILQWLAQAAPVRPALAAWRRLGICAGVLGTPLTALRVAQLPSGAATQWVALPFADEASRPPDGCLSIVFHGAVPAPPGTLWSGLLVDEWTEVIPARSEVSAVSLSYDHARAEAPQAVLLAVAPAGAATNWDFDTLVDIVRETLQLAKLRAVDLDALADLGQVFPAIALAANEAGDTISADTGDFAGGVLT